MTCPGHGKKVAGITTGDRGQKSTGIVVVSHKDRKEDIASGRGAERMSRCLYRESTGARGLRCQSC